MIRINTYEDIEKLRQRKELSEELLDELEQYFKEVVESLTDDNKAWKAHDLSAEGPFWILEPGVDDPENLTNFGSLLEAPIEFTSLVRLTDTDYFRAVLVLDNEYCLVVFSEVGRFGELDNHLTQYLVD